MSIKSKYLLTVKYIYCFDKIIIKNTLSITNLDRCIGCGLCFHHCPEEAKSLKRTGLREVLIPPPQIV